MTTPHLDVERARFNMIEQQIRPWEVLDQSVLDLLMTVKRETFVPAAYRNLAFADMEIPLTLDGIRTEESMLAPKVEARLLQALNVRPDDIALEIGAGSGYMAALLAAKAHQVVSLEIHAGLAAFARNNLQRNGFSNASVLVADGARGLLPKGIAAQYDVIMISGGLPFVPETFLEHLKVHGRLAAFVGTATVMRAELVTRTGEKTFDAITLFETQVPFLKNVEQPSRFRF